VVDYLKKPVDLTALRSAIRRLVPPPDPVTDRVTRTRQALDAYPPKPFDPMRFAHQLGVGEGYLRRAFREAYKVTPRRYLTDRRLERAATLLRITRRGVEQIAHEVGFPNSVWFTKVFSRAYRMSPSAYRTTAPGLSPSGPRPRPLQRP
jgi:transcriptional regulator GlxA family with amidase domain